MNRPRRSLSIRTRLTLAVAIVFVVTLLLSGAAFVRATRAALVDEVDAKLKGYSGRDFDRGWSPYDGAGEQEQSEGAYYAKPVARLVFAPDGQFLYGEASGFPEDPDPLPAVSSIGGDELNDIMGSIVTVPSTDGSFDYRLLVQQAPNGLITVAAAPLKDVDSTMDRLVWLLVLIGVVALAVAMLASWLLIRRGLRPIDQMIGTASAIASGDLSRRVDTVDPGTELGRLGGALNEMLHQIEGALRARAASEDRLRTFVADAAHELRTPLTSLRGYAELYRQGALPDTESVDTAMRQIESEGSRMARLVDDLLLLARLDQQRGLEFGLVNLTEVVRDAVSAFRAVEPERPVTHALGEEVRVCGDRLRLRQVVDNLLSNVRAHAPGDTLVHVAVAIDGDSAVVSVCDEGPGISAEDQAKIFDRFWRGGAPRVRSRSGTGLGLAIVASLVEAHGGSIGVSSEVGKGATFTVRLPLARESDPCEGSRASREDAPTVDERQAVR